MAAAHAEGLGYAGVAVLVPCYNEDRTVGAVTRDFLRALPGCTVYVYDNNSSDCTAAAAQAAGVVVLDTEVKAARREWGLRAIEEFVRSRERRAQGARGRGRRRARARRPRRIPCRRQKAPAFT